MSVYFFHNDCVCVRVSVHAMFYFHSVPWGRGTLGMHQPDSKRGPDLGLFGSVCKQRVALELHVSPCLVQQWCACVHIFDISNVNDGNATTTVCMCVCVENVQIQKHHKNKPGMCACQIAPLLLPCRLARWRKIVIGRGSNCGIAHTLPVAQSGRRKCGGFGV